MYRKLELDGAQLTKTDALLADVLAGGLQLTRRALAEELAGAYAPFGFRLVNLRRRHPTHSRGPTDSPDVLPHG